MAEQIFEPSCLRHILHDNCVYPCGLAWLVASTDQDGHHLELAIRVHLSF